MTSTPWARIRLGSIAVLTVALAAMTGCAPPGDAKFVTADLATSPFAAATAEPTSEALAGFLARIPSFPPPPPPVRVTLPHPPGKAAWISRIPTSQPVAFITIDDGRVKSPDALEIIKAARVPVSLFLSTDTIQDNKPYFAKLQDLGAVIEAHTVSHPRLTTLGYDQQRHELCHSADLLENWYGKRPVYFRPPHGTKNDDTLRAAWSCGLAAGFYWRAAVTDGALKYQNSATKLQPGDIIVLHFRSTFAADFIAALEAIKEAGLTPALLEDYVVVE